MKKLIYIVSSPRAGSTLLSNILGGHSAMFNVGELTSINGFINSNSRQSGLFECKCACGTYFLECEFWSKIIDSVAEKLEISPSKINTKVHTRNKNFQSHIFLRSYLSELNLIATNTEEAKKASIHAFTILDEVVRESACSVLVDSSKSLLNLMCYYQHKPDDWELKIIHLQRNGDAVAFSKCKARIKQKMPGTDYYKNLAGCLHYNSMISKYLKNKIHKIVSLEALCENFPTVSSELAEFISSPAIKNISLEPATKSRCDIGGSKSVGHGDKIYNLNLDKSWCSQMTISKKLYSKLLHAFWAN